MDGTNGKKRQTGLKMALAENRKTYVFDSLELFTERRIGRAYYWAAAGLAVLAITAFAAFSAVDDTGAAGGVFLGGIVVLGVTLLAFFATGGRPAGPAPRLANKELLKALGETSPDAMIITRSDGAVLYANAAYRRLAGTSEVERLLPLDRVFAGYPEISGPLYRLSRLLQEGRSGSENVELPLENGDAKVARVSVRPLDLALGNADCPSEGEKASASLWQVTELEEAYRPAAAEGDLTAYWLQQASMPCFAFDEDGCIVDGNDSFWGMVESVGSKKALLGRPWQQLLGISDQAVIEGDEPRVLKTKLTPKSGSELDLSVHLGPATAKSAANRFALVQVLPSLRGRADRAGSRPAIDANILENAPIAIAWVAKSGLISRTNAACRSLVGDAATVGKPFLGVFDDGFRGSVTAAFDSARNGKSVHLPGEIRLNTQRDMFSQVSVLPGAIDPDADDETAAIVYLVDTTEQKTLEVQFAQSQKMQAVGQLAGGVAHDFNNMLTAMIGFCDLLLAKHQPGDPSFADIMQIKQNANRAANLVRHLLAFSRQQTLRPTVLWLPDTIADLKDLLNRLLGENVSLDIKHDRDLGLVKVDEGQLEQAIINLCVNARDAMPDGGTVTVRTENISKERAGKLGHALMPAADYVMIEVADTGTGIAKEDLGKIFEPFFTTKEVGQGTGLGLSMVYGVVKQTGGFIFPESTVGEGTAFKIYLPLHVEEAKSEDETATASEDVAKRDLTGMGKILLVEDEEAVRSFASRALSTRGYTVLEAPSGEIALDLMREQGAEIDLVVSDVVMPEMDGPTLVKESKEFCPDAKIIFISGYAEDAFQKNLDPDEEFTFLPKPFSLKQLAEKVKEVMQAAG